MLDEAPAPGKTLLHIPLFESRVAWIGQRFAHDLAELADEPSFESLGGASNGRALRVKNLRLGVPFKLVGMSAQALDIKEPYEPKQPQGSDNRNED